MEKPQMGGVVFPPVTPFCGRTNTATIPLILYHNPYLTGCWLNEKIIARLYNDSIIDAIKESA